jgi:hypothetical protein
MADLRAIAHSAPLRRRAPAGRRYGLERSVLNL